MKLQEIETERKFEPVTIQITFETQKEIDDFYELLFNYQLKNDNSPIKSLCILKLHDFIKENFLPF